MTTCRHLIAAADMSPPSALMHLNHCDRKFGAAVVPSCAALIESHFDAGFSAISVASSDLVEAGVSSFLCFFLVEAGVLHSLVLLSRGSPPIF